jgi:hypothetical protein
LKLQIASNKHFGALVCLLPMIGDVNEADGGAQRRNETAHERRYHTYDTSTSSSPPLPSPRSHLIQQRIRRAHGIQLRSRLVVSNTIPRWLLLCVISLSTSPFFVPSPLPSYHSLIFDHHFPLCPFHPYPLITYVQSQRAIIIDQDVAIHRST